MSALAEVPPILSVEEYLATEELAPRKREYLGGFVYEMAGASESHNRIASNLTRLLGNHLLGSPCEYFGSDMKLKVDQARLSYFYYPDGMVACDPTDHGKDYRERPSVIIEITSESTRGIDAREKMAAYRQLDSLEAYVRVEQSSPVVLVERRIEDGWDQRRFFGLDAVADVDVLGIKLALHDVYDRVAFST